MAFVNQTAGDLQRRMAEQEVIVGGRGQHDPFAGPRDAIERRIAELDGIRDRYLAYQQDRVNERDHHGAWDVAINLSETECEIAGLRFALDKLP